MKPYVIIIHTPTKRAFTLDRGYNIVDSLIEKAYPAVFGSVEADSKWIGWVPQFEYQRPEWANEIIKQDRVQEFTAWWIV